MNIQNCRKSNTPLHGSPSRVNVLLFRLAIVLLLGFFIGGCATGSAILTGKKRPPISPDSVRIYSTPPQKPYEVIAITSATSYWSWAWNEQAKMDTATREMRVKAAQLGANGVILRSLGSEPIGATGTSLGSGLYSGSVNNMRTMDGIAIYVPSLNDTNR